MKYDLPKKHPRTDRGERTFDTTQLKEKQYGQQIHRDYAAHYFRWGFAKNFVKKGMSVLEVGCGQDFPLAKILAASMSNVPSTYLGVDMNKLKPPFKAKWLKYNEQFDFTSRWRECLKDNEDGFEVIISFEVIEHMSKKHGKKLLKGMRQCISSTGTLIISTPVYNGKHMAANHIHEYQYDELKELIEECGFVVERTHGTFMTSNAMKRVCSKEEMALVNELKKFYCWDILANFMAPKYPEHSSNCIWILRPDCEEDDDDFDF